MSAAKMSTTKAKSFSFFSKKKDIIDTPIEEEKKEKKEKKLSRPFNSTPTIIARDLTIEGQITSSGVIEIEGTVEGNIKGNSVILLQNGVLNGDVEAESFSVRGKFTGNIKANNVNIAHKAQVSGAIEYALLSVEDGASVDAKFKKIGSKVV